MLDLIEAQSKEPPGPLRVENSSLRAQRIIAEELDRLGWTTEQLAARRRHDPAKLAFGPTSGRRRHSPSKRIANLSASAASTPPKPTCTVPTNILAAAIQATCQAKEFVGI
ncbi:MAG: hypothetical protein ACXW3Z_03650 [Limisphaerales bacterium]